MLIYQDDCLVATGSFRHHIETLQSIFQKYDDANIRFNAFKSSLCVPKAQYLGWEITKNGLGISDNRCEIIRKIKPCRNVREVRALLGAVNYFRRLCPKISTIASSLYRLLRKDEPFVWGPEQQKALDTIKATLTSGAVLAWPREKEFDKYPLILEVDASPFGIGCLVKQADHQNIERIIAYNGRSLTRHERNLSQVMLETMALVFAIKCYERLLGSTNHPFIVRSDCLSLTYLNSLIL
jgi:hypothetical protein